MNALTRETAALVRALRERDQGTSIHSDRTSEICVALGTACDLSASDLATLRLAAHLHDIGKIGVPDRVLLKPGRLDESERELMNSHSQRGYDILTSIPGEDVLAVAAVVLHHHEGFDGSGYPGGLKGEDIPYLSRIVAIADSYDALATIRPYHQPRTHDVIMGMLFGENGHKYDPHFRSKFAAFIENSPHKAEC